VARDDKAGIENVCAWRHDPEATGRGAPKRGAADSGSKGAGPAAPKWDCSRVSVAWRPCRTQAPVPLCGGALVHPRLLAVPLSCIELAKGFECYSTPPAHT